MVRGAVVVALVLVAFYQVENWRGKQAWQAFKAEQERKGVVMDWRKLIPPPVPDALNAYKAPMMREWFGERGKNPLGERISPAIVFSQPAPDGGILAEIKILSPAEAFSEADIYLVYAPPIFYLLSEQASGDLRLGLRQIPLIVMDDVLLLDAIRNLARQSELNYMLDPRMTFEFERNGQPLVNLRWENITALQALAALLANYDLEMFRDPRVCILRIQRKTQAKPRLLLAGNAAERIRELLAEHRLAEPPGVGVQQLRAATGDFVLIADAPEAKAALAPPARIELRADGTVSAADLQELLTDNGAVPVGRRIRVTSKGPSFFQVIEIPMPVCRASDYLARTDRFEEEFQVLRTALKRPAVRLEGAYEYFPEMPIPNFVPIRVLGQVLAQRAQAHLLRDNPDEALREIQLIHDMCGLLENKPSGKPTTLVAAMIRVAMTGLYTETISQGFRLGKWREAQLRELQEMLSTVRLAPAVEGALALERAGRYHTLENLIPEQFARIYLGNPGNPGPPMTREKLKSPAWWFIKLAPRGWVYQNLLTSARLEEPLTAPYDSGSDTLDPTRIDQGHEDRVRRLSRWSPYQILASICVPNFVRAWEVTARNHALVAQAHTACALERYRLARGSYPETIEELIPEFTGNLLRDIITGDHLLYSRTGPDKFLLYSVGWNRIDEGGRANKEDDRVGADWIWPQFSESMPTFTTRR